MEPWMTDESVKDIPKEKLLFLAQMMGSRPKEGNQKETLQTLLPLIREAKERGLQFTQAEVAAAITAIRRHSSKEENERIETILKKVHYHENP